MPSTDVTYGERCSLSRDGNSEASVIHGKEHDLLSNLQQLWLETYMCCRKLWVTQKPLKPQRCVNPVSGSLQAGDVYWHHANPQPKSRESRDESHEQSVKQSCHDSAWHRLHIRWPDCYLGSTDNICCRQHGVSFRLWPQMVPATTYHSVRWTQKSLPWMPL